MAFFTGGAEFLSVMAGAAPFQNAGNGLAAALSALRSLHCFAHQVGDNGVLVLEGFLDLVGDAE